jgi:pimeloyl-ACP methyl ester carboxylesterase
MTAREQLVRGMFGILNDTVPGVAARWAEKLFFSAPRRSASPRLRAFLATGRFRRLQLKGERIATWSWGEGPAVYLVHGWAGRGGQLAAFVPPLVREGFTVVTFDAPGHGASSGGRTSLLDFARALRALVHHVGPAAGVIAHSLGAAATARALGDGLEVGRAVFIAPPADPGDWSRRFADRLGISPEVLQAMQARSERRLGVAWSDLNVPRLGAASGVPLLVIHDGDDEEVPRSNGAAIAAAWPDARLLTTRGLGHHRILRDASVVGDAVAFLSAAKAQEPAPAGDPFSDPLFLDRYMFDRDWRWDFERTGTRTPDR